MARLGDYIEQIRGVSYKPEDVCSSTDNDAVAILRANNIQDDGLNFDDLVYVKKSKILDKQYIQNGDIIVCASSGSKSLVGKAAIASENFPVAFGAFCKVVRPKKLIPSYIGYFFQSPKYRSTISELSGGANINNIRNEHIDELDIVIVSEKEQESIVNQLDDLSNLISLRKQQLSKIDELVKSRFIELFGDRYTNDKKWDNKPLYECADFYNGKAHEQVVDENGEYILVTSRCIASDISDYRRTNELLFPLQVNDIAMVMSDLPNGRALAKCILIDEDGKYTLNQRICCLRNYLFNPIFFYHLLNRHEYFLSFNDGNAQTNLRKDDLLACNIIIPPLELQNQFATFVEQTDKSKLAVQQSLEKLETLKKSLMQQYFG